MSRTTNEQERCRVGSGTDNPCLQPAVVKIGGIAFCEACAREQEAYFAIGELTEGSQDESLVELLDRMRGIRRRRRVVNCHESDAA